MITAIRIASKLRNDGFRVGMNSDKAVSILRRTVAPIACVRFFFENKDEIIEQLSEWEATQGIATND